MTHFKSCETASVVRFEVEEEDYDGVPDFLNIKMNENDLLKLSREVLLEYHDPLAILFFFRNHEKSPFLNFICNVQGMIYGDEPEILEELKSLWGFYLSCQSDPDETARMELFQVLRVEKYWKTISSLLGVCRSLSVLSHVSKRRIIIQTHKLDNFRLSFYDWQYLFNLPTELVERMFDLSGYRYYDEESYRDFKISVNVFENLIEQAQK